MRQLPSVSMSSTCISVHGLTPFVFAVSQWNPVVPRGSRRAQRRAFFGGVSYMGLGSGMWESLVSALVKSTRQSWWGLLGVAFRRFWSAFGRTRKRLVSITAVAGCGQQKAAELGRHGPANPKPYHQREQEEAASHSQMQQMLFLHCWFSHSQRAKPVKALA